MKMMDFDGKEDGMNGKLLPRAFAFAGGMLWGLAMLTVGLVHMKYPNYGQAFLEMTSSIYPGYHVSTTLKAVLVGTGYAVVDGAIGGALLAWFYNLSLNCPLCKKLEKS